MFVDPWIYWVHAVCMLKIHIWHLFISTRFNQYSYIIYYLRIVVICGLDYKHLRCTNANPLTTHSTICCCISTEFINRLVWKWHQKTQINWILSLRIGNGFSSEFEFASFSPRKAGILRRHLKSIDSSWRWCILIYPIWIRMVFCIVYCDCVFVCVTTSMSNI